VLKTNSQKKPEIELFVMGKLQKEIRVFPEYLYFGIIDTSKEVIDPKNLERTATVKSGKGDAFTIEKIEPSSNWITTEIETYEKGKHTVVIKLDKDKLPKGKFREKVTMHTEHSKRPEAVTIIIDAKVI
jgi:hypothetical protein